MNIKKSLLKPYVWREPLHLVSPDILGMKSEYTQKGNYFSIFRINNRIGESLVIINEFNESTIVKGIDSRIERKIAITFNKLKTNTEDCNEERIFIIELKEEELREKKAIYFPEINLVITLVSMYQYYDIRHPYAIRNYDKLLEMAVKELMDTISPLSLMWWVNEPTQTNKTYYMSLGDEIVIVPKTNFDNTEITFDLIKPKSHVVKAGMYATQSHSLKDFKDGMIKELNFSLGKFQFSVYLSTSESLLRTELDKQKKNYKNLIPKNEHDNLVDMINTQHNKELKEIHEKHGKEIELLLKEMKDRIEILESERNNYKKQWEEVLNLSKITSQFHTTESAIKQAEAKTEIARHSVTKERVAIWSDIMKYGLGGLITLVTILVAQKSSK